MPQRPLTSSRRYRRRRRRCSHVLLGTVTVTKLDASPTLTCVRLHPNQHELTNGVHACRMTSASSLATAHFPSVLYRCCIGDNHPPKSPVPYSIFEMALEKVVWLRTCLGSHPHTIRCL